MHHLLALFLKCFLMICYNLLNFFCVKLLLKLLNFFGFHESTLSWSHMPWANPEVMLVSVHLPWTLAHMCEMSVTLWSKSGLSAWDDVLCAFCMVCIIWLIGPKKSCLVAFGISVGWAHFFLIVPTLRFAWWHWCELLVAASSFLIVPTLRSQALLGSIGEPIPLSAYIEITALAWCHWWAFKCLHWDHWPGLVALVSFKCLHWDPVWALPGDIVVGWLVWLQHSSSAYIEIFEPFLVTLLWADWWDYNIEIIFLAS